MSTVHGGEPRRLPRLLTALALTGSALLLSAPPSAAHAVLLFASPAIEGAVPTSPKTLSLVFDEPVQASGPHTVRIAASSGQQVPVGSAGRGEGGRQLTLPVRDTLRTGVYTVRWQVTAQDGDVMSGSYRFAVGSTTAGLSAGSAGGRQQVSGATLTAILRWVLFGAFALVLGGLTGEWLARRSGIEAPRSWARAGAVGGLVASLGLAVLIAGGGSLVAGLTAPSGDALWGGRPGVLAICEVAGWSAVVAALGRARRPGTRAGTGAATPEAPDATEARTSKPDRTSKPPAGITLGACAGMLPYPAWPVVWIGLAVAVLAEALRAHPATASAGWGPVLTTVHLTAAAVWTGALAHLVWVGVARRWDSRFRAALGAYARIALWLLIAVVITGALSSLLLLSPSELLELPGQPDSAYGVVLVVKLALVAAVCGIALAARRRMATRAPHLLVRVEAGALAGVLAVTAWLSVSTPPRTQDAVLPFAPPATGDAITVGGRADLIGIVATASQGQVVLHLTAPTTDLERPDTRSYQASASLADATGRARRIALRDCGGGCFYAPVAWRHGANLLTVHAAAKGWEGGTETLRVMWPVRPDPALLTRTVKAMRAVPEVTLHEQTASSTAGADLPAIRLEMSGREFIADEVYAAGLATQTSRFTDAEGATVLALGYPSQRLAFELTLDEHDRVIRETAVGPNHIIHRSFAYPHEADAADAADEDDAADEAAAGAHEDAADEGTAGGDTANEGGGDGR